ncbi:hypothetical protein DXA57_09750 [Blautia sp. OF03-15BH]|uniref:acyltransferase family protein n=1 Tax=Blautia sp. OF03-15BH TaxID=2292287 RepID=UPI000E52C9D0|nr:acyltransferase family protein [Blautia sp. OF03-15BH]RGY00741.1 hypothetical protein DXA57_09750 [Blautia sp. OF03-15BH]
MRLLIFYGGGAILLVLWGHCLQGCNIDSFNIFQNWMFKIIYSFHMPLFMLISGYLFWKSRNKKLKDIFIRRIVTIGIPFLVWNTLLYFRKVVILHEELSIMKYLQSIRYGIWFLQSIFIITIEVAIIIKIAERINGKVLVFRNFFLICVALGNLFIDGIIGVHTANLFVPFVVGYLYAERKFDGKREINLNKLFLVCSGIVYIILFLFYKEWSFDYISGVNPMTSEYKPYIQMEINIYRWIIGIVGSIVFTEIMQLLYVKYMNLRFVKFVNRIGKDTLQIYVMQCFFLEGVISTVVTIVANKLGTNILVYNIVCYNTVITLGIAVVYAWLFDIILQVLSKHKIMYKVLFGCA